VNDQAVILGFLAFSCLQKLIKQAALIDVCASHPYTTVIVKIPFELQSSLLTVFKEELRGLIKQKSYQVMDMVPHVAINYAASKNIKLRLETDDPVITILETDGFISPLNTSVTEVELPLPFQFDILDIKIIEDLTHITFVYGSETKNLKKQAQTAQAFNVEMFLVTSEVLSSAGNYKERGEDLLSYYRHLICGYLAGMGCFLESRNDQSKKFTITKITGIDLVDPLILPSLQPAVELLFFETPNSLKNVKSCLSLLTKILKLLKFSFRINFQGKFQESDIKEMSLDHENVVVSLGSQKCVKLEILDTFGRHVSVTSIQILKKNIECEIDVLNLILMHVLVHKKLFPESLPRPKQVAVLKSDHESEELLDVLTKRRLQGESVFRFEHKDKASEKQALDYQIDNLLYYSESERVIKERSFN
jgi:hypothetical protein